MANQGAAGAGPIEVLAQGLRSLRDNAGAPTGAELTAATGLSEQAVAEALGGAKLPSQDTTLKLVRAWGGDATAWEAYWRQIADMANPAKPAAAARQPAEAPTQQVAIPKPAPAPAAPAADASNAASASRAQGPSLTPAADMSHPQPHPEAQPQPQGETQPPAQQPTAPIAAPAAAPSSPTAATVPAHPVPPMPQGVGPQMASPAGWPARSAFEFQPLADDDPRTVGGYKLRARLGAGGMGRVYLSFTPGGRPVALKVVRSEYSDDPEFRGRFLQETQAAMRVHGLYTAQVVDADAAGSPPWLATAYVPGPSLAQAVAAHGPLPLASVRLLVAGVAEALQAIHSAGVVHRDLKPSNVLLAADGPRVIDFGIARAADATPLTMSGMRIGSPQYMAPEQALGRSAGPATDVFALGALAMYAASRMAPFGEGNDAALLYRIVHEEPDLSQCPAELQDLVRRCLAKEPGDRPSPAEIIAECSSGGGTSLKITDGWLPAPVASDIARRTTAPVPPELPATPVPAAAAPLAPTRVEAPAKPRKRWGLRLSLAAVLVLGSAVGGAFAYKAITKKDTTDTAGQSPAGVSQQHPGSGTTSNGSSNQTSGGGSSQQPTSGSSSDTGGSGSGSGGAGATSTPGGLETMSQQPSDTTTLNNTNKTIGTQLGAYTKVQLPSGYAIDFSADPTHPVQGGGGDEKMGFSWYDSPQYSKFQADRAVVFDANEVGSYDNCLNDTRYQQDVHLSQLTVGALFCVHTASSKFVLVKIDQLPDAATQANPYVVVDLTVWQGR